MPLGKLSWVRICALRVLSLPLELIAPLIEKLSPLLGFLVVPLLGILVVPLLEVLVVPLLGSILRMPA